MCICSGLSFLITILIFSFVYLGTSIAFLHHFFFFFAMECFHNYRKTVQEAEATVTFFSSSSVPGQTHLSATRALFPLIFLLNTFFLWYFWKTLFSSNLSCNCSKYLAAQRGKSCNSSLSHMHCQPQLLSKMNGLEDSSAIPMVQNWELIGWLPAPVQRMIL